MRLYIILIFILSALNSSAQIFTHLKINSDTIEVEKYKVEGKWRQQVYLRFNYGDYFILNPKDVDRLKDKIVQKVQIVYTDYPKGTDLKELNLRRLNMLQAVMPDLFNKPWIKWEFVKQTGCKNINDAYKSYHGFVIFTKAGEAPNAEVEIPAHVRKKLDQLKTKVTYTLPDTSKKFETWKNIASFLSGPGVQITNLAFLDSLSFGQNHFLFQEKEGTIKIIDGLLMTTGLAVNAIGPNNSPSKTHMFNMLPAKDKDLKKISSQGPLFDACTMEFDILIDADTLIFEYLFGSEEYPEYLDYHDVFGIFLTGPGHPVAQNVAMIPELKIPVAVNNINHLVNNHLYVSNNYESDLHLFKAWQYDGFTKVMQSKVKVDPNKKYHVKIVIADYGDPFYDSGIFIQAGGIRAKRP